MTSWTEFAQQAPELAAFGQARYQTGVAYLATVRADGGPRVHPVRREPYRRCSMSQPSRRGAYGRIQAFAS